MANPIRSNVTTIEEIRQTFRRIGLAIDPLVKNNFAATTNPTINDDAGDGYSVGSLWVNLTLDRGYILTDSTVGAANWLLIAPEGGGGSGPADAKYIVQEAHADLSAEQSLGADPLTTGLLKNTRTGSIGVLSTAVAGTDYQAAGNFQPLDGTLTALAALDATPGILTQTGADAFAKGQLSGDVTTVGASLVTTIANKAVTFAKMQDMSPMQLLGRGTAGVGPPEPIGLGTGLSMAGTVLNAKHGFSLPFFAAATPVAIL